MEKQTVQPMLRWENDVYPWFLEVSRLGENEENTARLPEKLKGLQLVDKFEGDFEKQVSYRGEKGEYLISENAYFPKEIPVEDRYFGSPALPAYNGYGNELCLGNKCWTRALSGEYYSIETIDGSAPPIPGLLTQ